MHSRRKRCRPTSGSRDRSVTHRSVTPVPQQQHSSQRPSAAQRALLMGLAFEGPYPEPRDVTPPRKCAALTVEKTPGRSMTVTGKVPCQKGGHVRPSQPASSLQIVEKIEAMDLDEEEADDIMSTTPWHMRRWIQELPEEVEELPEQGVPEPQQGAEKLVDVIEVSPCVIQSCAPSTSALPANVQPSVSETTVNNQRGARGVFERSELDSDYDDEFDVVGIESAAYEGRVVRDIPDDDEEPLDEPTRNLIAAVEEAMDDEANRLLGVSTSYTWEEDFDSFRGVPEVFSGPTPGPIKDYDTSYDAFTDIWSNDIIELIVRETNRYAKQTIDSLKAAGTLKPSSRLHQWVETDANEIMVFLAVCMYMGIDNRPSQNEYWRTNDFLEMPRFKQLLSYNRFILLNKFVHFVDNTDINQGSQQSGANLFSKKLAKIQPVISHLGEKISSLYNLSKNISVDESLTLFKGRLSWVQAIRKAIV